MATVVETVERDGITVLVYDDGTEKNAANGHFIKAPPKHAITAENSNAFVRRRWEKYRLASNRRIVREAAAIDSSISTPSEAFALVASKQFVALMDYDKPRIDELEKLEYIMTGYDPKKDGDGSPAAQVAAALAGADTARTIERIIKDVMQSREDATIPIQLHETKDDGNP